MRTTNIAPLFTVLLFACVECMAEGNRQSAFLSNPAVRESSGIVAARGTPGVFFTHNDSGSLPAVFAFDERGTDLGTFLIGMQVMDSEDIGAFTANGRHWLFLADTGDNKLKQSYYAIHFMEEPRVNRAAAMTREPQQVKDARTMLFTYEDGAHNCEAAAIDQSSGLIYLVEKNEGNTCGVYELPTPFAGNRWTNNVMPVARKIATLNLTTATGMDISADSLRAIVCTYGDAYEYTRTGAKEDWAETFARKPVRISLPSRTQGEAVCYDQSAANCYLTCEVEKSDAPCPIYRIPLAGQRKDK